MRDQPLPTPRNVLIVDDDPEHLKIYGWILEQAGCVPVPCLVRPHGIDLPEAPDAELVVLDYVLHCDIPTPEIAHRLRSAYRGAPIILLSDIHGLPADVAPFVTEFVRKGEPARLVATVTRLLGMPNASNG